MDDDRDDRSPSTYGETRRNRRDPDSVPLRRDRADIGGMDDWPGEIPLPSPDLDEERPERDQQ